MRQPSSSYKETITMLKKTIIAVATLAGLAALYGVIFGFRVKSED